MIDNTKITIKLVSAMKSVGPKKLRKVSSVPMAAKKIAFNSNLKVGFLSKGSQENIQRSKDGNRAITMAFGGQVSPEIGVAAQIAWEFVMRKHANAYESYLNAANAYSKAKADTYQRLGIIVKSILDKPEMTSDQLEEYNATMSNHSFMYYTYAISYRDFNSHAVRSKSFKTLNPISLEQLRTEVEDMAIDLINNGKITMTVVDPTKEKTISGNDVQNIINSIPKATANGSSVNGGIMPS